MRTLVVAPSMSTLTRSIGISNQASHQWESIWKKVCTLSARFTGLLCGLLLVVDVVANNWEMIDYVGDAAHLLTPLFDVLSVDDLEKKYYFPQHSSPNEVSKIGRYMIETTIQQSVHDTDGTFYLSLGTFEILDSKNDICDAIAQTYPMDVEINSTVRIGVVMDAITYVRGNTLTHVFGNTLTAPTAPLNSNDTMLRAMKYVPSRVTTDFRLTTPITIPPSGQRTNFDVSMYRFLNMAYCSGCKPQTELGLDLCTIEYYYNARSKQLIINSSKAVIGSHHQVGLVFRRNWGPIASLYIRGISVLIAIGAYIASEKTVKWTEPSDLNAWYKRLIHKVAPTLYRHPSYAFEFSYMCFNSDTFVLLYAMAVLVDENISMVYSRTMYRWHEHGGTDIWVDLRIMAMSFRWLWFNCFLVKVVKWICNFFSKAIYSGDSFIVGCLNFSSVMSIYLGVVVLFLRNEFIEYGNSVRFTLSSTSQNLDAISVLFFDSWYIRAAWPFGLIMAINLIVVLTIDHVWNRKWWKKQSMNSLGRQHMYNSTSILSESEIEFVERSGYGGVAIDMKARALCTMQWFFSTHLICFGLPENPKTIRMLATNKIGQGKVLNDPAILDHSSVDSKRGQRRTSGGAVKPPEVGSVMPFFDDEQSRASESDPTQRELFMILQDRDGYVRLFDADKREVQALGMEVKILRDSSFHIG